MTQATGKQPGGEEHGDSGEKHPENGQFVEQLPKQAQGGVEVRRADADDDHHRPNHVDSLIHKLAVLAK